MPIALVAILAVAILVVGLAVMFAAALGRAAARGDAELERQWREHALPELPEIAVSRKPRRVRGARARASESRPRPSARPSPR